VLSFFRKGPTGLEHLVSKATGLLGEARHSFDLATLALLTETDAAAVDTDIRETDERMSRAEQELRSELVVHISVQGASDIGSAFGLALLTNKIERIGAQTRNILDLAESDVTLAGQSDTDDLLTERTVISALFGEAAELMAEPNDDALDDMAARCEVLQAEHQAKIVGYLHSAEPGSVVVPRAIYYRYLKRVVANLVGVVAAATEPMPSTATLGDNADEPDGLAGS
jgi:hypothetical protein